MSRTPSSHRSSDSSGSIPTSAYSATLHVHGEHLAEVIEEKLHLRSELRVARDELAAANATIEELKSELLRSQSSNSQLKTDLTKSQLTSEQRKKELARSEADNQLLTSQITKVRNENKALSSISKHSPPTGPTAPRYEVRFRRDLNPDSQLGYFNLSGLETMGTLLEDFAKKTKQELPDLRLYNTVTGEEVPLQSKVAAWTPAGVGWTVGVRRKSYSRPRPEFSAPDIRIVVPDPPRDSCRTRAHSGARRQSAPRREAMEVKW
jgi:hypothetical protein